MIAPLLKGLALGLLLSISVGPVIFAILKQSINNGYKGGFAFVAGVSASDISLVLICNLFTQLFNSAMNHEKVIGVAGSAFLIIMGIYNIFFKKIAKVTEGGILEKKFSKRHMLATFFSGYFMNMLNPGVFLFWFAASATILEDSQTVHYPFEYRFIVFITCLLFVLTGDIAKVLLAGKIRSRLTPHNIHIIDLISGVILVGFGLALIWGILFGNVIAK